MTVVTATLPLKTGDTNALVSGETGSFFKGDVRRCKGWFYTVFYGTVDPRKRVRQGHSERGPVVGVEGHRNTPVKGRENVSVRVCGVYVRVCVGMVCVW